MTMTSHQPHRGSGVELDHALRSFKKCMFGCALVFALIALIAGALGFADISHPTVVVAKILFFISVVMFALLMTFGIIIRKDSNRR